MSASVVTGIVPGGKPHPAMKWSLLVALFVMVVLGLPRGATASPPSVQAPTGQQSGGVFYGPGPYSFATYISCTNGPSFSGSYSNALEGTHSFNFMGAADGSLLVRIDGGGAQLITSCGDPTPTSTVATYTVTYSFSGPPTPPPTPPPTQAPTPTPTPPPNGGGGGNGGSNGGGGGNHSGSPGAGHPTNAGPSAPTGQPTPTESPAAPVAAPVVSPGMSPSPSAGPKPSGKPAAAAKPATQPSHQSLWMMMWWLLLILILLATTLITWLAYRSPRFQAWWQSAWLGWRVRLGPWWFRVRIAAKRLIHIHGHNVPKRRGLSESHHTGRLLAHHHTSYPALAFLLMLSAVLLATYSAGTRADSALLSLTVLGAPPTVGATIDQPVTGDHFGAATTTVRGTCPQNLMVEIYRNGIFAGSVMCDAGGLYSLIITLVPDQNELVARVLDGAGQYGPDSNHVIVFYDLPATPTPTPTPSITPTPTPSTGPTPTPVISPTPGPGHTPTPKITPRPSSPPGPGGKPGEPPFLLTTKQHSATGLEINQDLEWVVTISGGKKPYHLTWDWGDGVKDNFNPASPGDITAHHRYTAAGSYRLVLRANDAAGREATLTLVAEVNGQPAVAGPSSNNDRSALFVAWPVLFATALLTLSFWLGEHHKIALWHNSRPATS